MTQSMVKLTDEQQQLITNLVQTGRFDGANDVVATGLRLLEERERKINEFVFGLEAEIQKGLESGPALPIEPAADLIASFRKRSRS